MARILIVDRSAEARHPWTVVLREGSYEVLAVADFASAVMATVGQAPHLVLVDFPLRDGGRHDLKWYLRMVSDSPPHIIALARREQDAETAREHGADVVLVKPVDLSLVLT